ncbi:MAG: hypothetical protein WCX48_02340 [Bacteroidales bacterium]
MKTKFLLPNKFIKVGFILLGLSILLMLFTGIFGDIKLLTKFPVFYIYNSGVFPAISDAQNHLMGFMYDDIHYELIVTLFVLGCVFIGFSRLKSEDEYTVNLRLESLLWAMYVNFAIFLFSVLFIYGLFFLEIQLYCLLAFLAIFNLRFYYMLYQSKKSSRNEK